MPDFDSKHLHDTLTALRSDTECIGLANADDVRRHGDARTRRTVAATGLTAGLCLVAAAIGVGTLGGGDKRAIETPADRGSISARTLVLADELQTSRIGPMTMESSGEGEGAPAVTSCQRETLAELGATKLWHRSFLGTRVQDETGVPEEEQQRVRQVIASFDTERAANRAYAAVAKWFESCEGVTQRGIERVAPSTVAGGRFEAVNFSRSITPRGDDGRTNPVVIEYVSYGIVGDALTVVSYKESSSEESFTDEELAVQQENPLQRTMRFAMQRLAGERQLDENGVPRSFRFAEERRGEWQNSTEPGGAGLLRASELGLPWQISPCAKTAGHAASSYATDALRSGALSVRLMGGDTESAPFRQLALYPDAASARTVAQELVDEYTTCATQPYYERSLTWTVAAAAEPRGATVAWADDSTGFARAVGVAQRGNAVLLVYEGHEDQPGPQSSAVGAVKKALSDNIDLICEVADCD